MVIRFVLSDCKYGVCPGLYLEHNKGRVREISGSCVEKDRGSVRLPKERNPLTRLHATWPPCQARLPTRFPGSIRALTQQSRTKEINFRPSISQSTPKVRRASRYGSFGTMVTRNRPLFPCKWSWITIELWCCLSGGDRRHMPIAQGKKQKLPSI